MTAVHPSAFVETQAIGERGSIGEFCVVGPRVVLGDDVTLHPLVVIMGDVSIASGTEVFPGAVLAKPPATSAALSRVPHAAGEVTIGEESSIGSHAVICTASDNALGRLPFSHERVQGPMLGHRVSVGSGAVILPSVSIGDDSTVAAGSLVTRDVAAGTTVSGRPARMHQPSA